MEIELFGKDFCAYCERSKRLLGEEGLKFDFYNVEADESKLLEMKQRTNNAKTVPQIFVNKELIGGYDELKKWVVLYKEPKYRLGNCNMANSMRNVDKLVCSFCESEYKITYDLTNTSGYSKFCPFCGEEHSDVEDEDDFSNKSDDE